MGMLGESWDNDSWLGVGNHVVKIAEHRMFEFNSGSPGVELILKTPDGKQVKHGFCLHPKATWKLANFCKDIGLTRKEADEFDVLQSQSYTRLIGKEVGVTVVKAGKYREVDETWPVSELAKREAMPKRPPAPAAPPAADGNDSDDEDLQL